MMMMVVVEGIYYVDAIAVESGRDLILPFYVVSTRFSLSAENEQADRGTGKCINSR